MKVIHFITTCGVIVGGLAMAAGGASALTASDSTDVQFTFNPMLTMALSSNELTIADLAPGSSGSSSDITITVNTNAVYGYTLSATVGNSTTYDTTNLKHASSNDAYFTSTSGTDVTSLSSGTWGYSTDAGAHYSGLPKYNATGATLNSASEAVKNAATTFRIGATAANGQLTGDYTNVINFTAVSKITNE